MINPRALDRTRDMQTNTIQRGTIVLGTISFENGASALGTEVVASAAFPAPDGDQTEQFESYEAGLRFLDACYEADCEARGVTPEPKAPDAPELDEEAAYYARLAAEEAAEAADHLSAEAGGPSDDDLPF